MWLHISHQRTKKKYLCTPTRRVTNSPTLGNYNAHLWDIYMEISILNNSTNM